MNLIRDLLECHGMRNTTLRRWGSLSVAILLVIGLLLALPAVAGEKVTICHATSSETNPYVEITVSVNAVYGPGGHFNENGTTQAGHEEDYFGPCEEPSTTTTTTFPTTTTAPPNITTTTLTPEVTTTTVTEITPTTTSTIPFDVIPTTTAVPVEVDSTVVSAVPTTEPAELPFTGIGSDGLALLASVSAFIGLVALVMSGRRVEV